MRPSELADIQDSYTAYCFDEVITMWGNYVDNELSEVHHDNVKLLQKLRLARLHELLGLKAPSMKGAFADPMSRF